MTVKSSKMCEQFVFFLWDLESTEILCKRGILKCSSNLLQMFVFREISSSPVVVEAAMSPHLLQMLYPLLLLFQFSIDAVELF